eukprot:COSAG05_NODE_649_length_8102_cov_157.470823_2_plen_68_part_00
MPVLHTDEVLVPLKADILLVLQSQSKCVCLNVELGPDAFDGHLLDLVLSASSETGFDKERTAAVDNA